MFEIEFSLTLTQSPFTITLHAILTKCKEAVQGSHD